MPRPICSSGQGSALSTESRARSKPKPGSISSPSAASRSTKSARIARGSRSGREVPAAMRPLAARCQRRLEPGREPLDAREHILLARDRLVKALLRDIARDRQTRGQRFVFAAKGAVELAQELGAEAGGERRARQVEDVADAFQADPRQRGDRLVRQAQRGEGQRGKTFTLAATCICRRIAEARRSGGRADGGGDGGAC